MAEVCPFHALHYDLDAVGSLGDVAAPPYDVIDAEQRAELLARSPYNAVAIDLPKPYGETGPSETGGDPYEHAARDDRGLARGRGAGRRPRAGDLGADPGLHRPRRRQPHPPRHPRPGPGRGLRDRPRSAPTSAPSPGPKEDRLDLTRATRHNLSPIFSLSTERRLAAGRAGARPDEPWGEATDDDGTVNRVWRVGDPAVHAAVTELLADAELLIADGHHRYETARAYRDEVGGEGAAQLHADGADRARRPRPHRLPHPPPALRLRRRPRAPAAASATGLRELFDVEEVEPSELDPAGEEGVGVFGLYDSHHKRAFRLRLKDTDRARPPRSTGKPEAYRRLDAAILEALVLKGIAGHERRRHRRQARPRLREERRGLARACSTTAPTTSPSSCARSRSSRSRAICRKRRDHAAEVDLLLPQGADRARLQPARLSAAAA